MDKSIVKLTIKQVCKIHTVIHVHLYGSETDILFTAHIK